MRLSEGDIVPGDVRCLSCPVNVAVGASNAGDCAGDCGTEKL